MLKVISLLFVLIAVSNAVERTANFTWGHIVKGKLATGVNVIKNNKGQHEIEWSEQFDNNNPITIYLSQIYEDTGLLVTLELDNLCGTYPKGSFQETVKYFILNKFRGTKQCPIKKGKGIIKYPLINTHNVDKDAIPCGPVIAAIHIVKNKNPKTGEAPLLLSSLFRGVISGDEC